MARKAGRRGQKPVTTCLTRLLTLGRSLHKPQAGGEHQLETARARNHACCNSQQLLAVHQPWVSLLPLSDLLTIIALTGSMADRSDLNNTHRFHLERTAACLAKQLADAVGVAHVSDGLVRADAIKRV
ncbi:hypothetical protein ACOMHN_034274 [Nucella lapillus]